MTPHDIARVRSSWHAIDSDRQQFGARFYARLFELAPDTRAMFKGDLAAQSAKLVATLHVVVEYLDRLDDVLPAVRQLGQRHQQEWQVHPEHYDRVREALLWALEQQLGQHAFDDELRRAWLLAYEAVAMPMQQAPDGATDAG
jgi:nitric oxide dioxygenase